MAGNGFVHRSWCTAFAWRRAVFMLIKGFRRNMWLGVARVKALAYMGGKQVADKYGCRISRVLNVTGVWLSFL